MLLSPLYCICFLLLCTSVFLLSLYRLLLSVSPSSSLSLSPFFPSLCPFPPLSPSPPQPPAVENEEDLEGTDPAGALVRCVMWLGLESDEKKWGRVDMEGEVAVYAETYQNQVS